MPTRLSFHSNTLSSENVEWRESMKTTRTWFWPIVLCAILVLPLILVLFHQNPTHKNPNPPLTHSEKVKATAKKPKLQIYWGVDSTTKADQAFLKCIKNHYGKPVVFGRYLRTKTGVSAGLTAKEAVFLHKQGIKIIPIFNHFTNATSYKNGAREAKEAIAYAKKIGMPKGTALFADIEPKYPVDEGFIRGWVDTLSASPYKPGIYGVFTNDNEISSAYKKAVAKDKKVASNTLIWSSNPTAGNTKKGNAPKFNPNAPKNIKATIWQYGIDGKACNIDTNLIKSNDLPFLW